MAAAFDVFLRKTVRVVLLENETINGVTDGLEPNGALRIRRSNGEVSIIRTGDVEQLRSEP
jgi:biotin-(acetyl-CoA carboxylase) ligase